MIEFFFNYMNSNNNGNYVKLIKFLRILWHLRYNWFQKWKFFGNFLSIILLLVKNSFQKIFQIVAMNSENSQRYYRCKNFKYVKETPNLTFDKTNDPKTSFTLFHQQSIFISSLVIKLILLPERKLDLTVPLISRLIKPSVRSDHTAGYKLRRKS